MPMTDLFPKTGWQPTAGLGGAIEGMRTGMGMLFNEQELAQADLLTQSKRLELQRAAAEEEAVGYYDRQHRREKAKYDLDRILSGKTAEKDDLNIDVTRAQLEGTRAGTKRANQTHSTTMMDRAIEIAKRATDANIDGLDPMTLFMIRKELGELGIDLPPGHTEAEMKLRELAKQERFTKGNRDADRRFSENVALKEMENAARLEREQLRAKAAVDRVKAAIRDLPKPPTTFQAGMIQKWESELKKYIESNGQEGMSPEEYERRALTAIQEMNQDPVLGRLGAVQGNPRPSLVESVQGQPAASKTNSVVPYPGKGAAKEGEIYINPKTNKKFKFLGYTPDGKIKYQDVD